MIKMWIVADSCGGWLVLIWMLLHFYLHNYYEVDTTIPVLLRHRKVTDIIRGLMDNECFVFLKKKEQKNTSLE